jgi:uncharacterized protein YwgA
MVKSGLDLLIALLYTNNQERIEGVTRLVKLLFLLVKEGGFKEFEKEYGFEAYNYGPWSSQVFDFTETLKELGLVMVEERELTAFEDRDFDLIEAEINVSEVPEIKENRIQIFSLTQDGVKVGEVIYKNLSNEERERIEAIKRRYNKMPLSDLLRYIYARFPQFTIKSLIQRKIVKLSPEEEFKREFPDSKVNRRILALVGTQPPMTLEEEKEAIRRLVKQRFGK